MCVCVCGGGGGGGGGSEIPPTRYKINVIMILPRVNKKKTLHVLWLCLGLGLFTVI